MRQDRFSVTVDPAIARDDLAPLLAALDDLGFDGDIHEKPAGFQAAWQFFLPAVIQLVVHGAAEAFKKVFVDHAGEVAGTALGQALIYVYKKASAKDLRYANRSGSILRVPLKQVIPVSGGEVRLMFAAGLHETDLAVAFDGIPPLLRIAEARFAGQLTLAAQAKALVEKGYPSRIATDFVATQAACRFINFVFQSSGIGWEDADLLMTEEGAKQTRMWDVAVEMDKTHGPDFGED